MAANKFGKMDKWGGGKRVSVAARRYVGQGGLPGRLSKRMKRGGHHYHRHHSTPTAAVADDDRGGVLLLLRRRLGLQQCMGDTSTTGAIRTQVRDHRGGNRAAPGRYRVPCSCFSDQGSHTIPTTSASPW